MINSYNVSYLCFFVNVSLLWACSLPPVTCMLMLMDPNVPQPQPSGQFNPGQYDFITNPAQPPKKSLIPTKGSSKKQRILLVVVGLLVFFIVAILLFSLLTSGSKSNVENMTAVLQQQTELSRVATKGKDKASTANAKSIAATTFIVIESQKTQLNNALAKQKIKINSKQLSAGKSTETDQTLAAAEKNGRFDDAFIQAIRTDLEDYQKTLKSAFNGTSSKSLRTTLDADYTQVNLILEDITKQ